jgi:hypothetical protein
MHRNILSLFACVAACALAIASAPAAAHLANIAAPLVAQNAASGSQASASNSTSTSSRHERARMRAARKARKEKPIVAVKAHAPERIVVQKISGRNFAAAQKTEQVEANARAERLYRASQFSAPILIDAKACKRIGANGESIYENC